MEKLLRLLILAALATVPVVGGFACYFLSEASYAVTSIGRNGTTTLAQANAALRTVNRACAPGPCGTLAEVDKLATHTSDLIVQSQLAVKHADAVSTTEAAMLPAWNTRFTATMDSVDAATVRIPPLIDAATDRLNGLAPLETALTTLVRDTDASSGATFTQAQAAIHDIDVAVADPNIAKLIANSASITGNLAATTGDFQARFHAVLYPPPCTTFWCRFARVWPYLKDAASMGEALYWTHALFADVKP